MLNNQHLSSDVDAGAAKPRRTLRYMIVGVLCPTILVLVALSGGAFSRQEKDWVQRGGARGSVAATAAATLAWCLFIPAIVGAVTRSARVFVWVSVITSPLMWLLWFV